VSKCATALYIYGEDRRRTYLDTCYVFREEEIPDLISAESMRYVGAPMTTRRTVKLKSVKFKPEEMNIPRGKIISSPLLTM
jgi:hypothetical protein